jgi:4'-phosphopantetheinyl transferase
LFPGVDTIIGLALLPELGDAGLFVGELAEMRWNPDEIHVWRVELDCPEKSVVALAASLSPAERATASRLQSPRLRRRWTSAHGALRYILSKYAETEPTSLLFEFGSNGKPRLALPIHDISFSLSHTDGLTLVAVAAGARIGIDAEMVHSGIEVESLSRRFFTPAEADEILALPGASRCEAFFRCWTRKEAILKAMGTGLSVPLNRFQVSIRSVEVQLVSIDGNSSQWTLVDISEQSVTAALATEGSASQLHRLKFQPPSS